MRPARTGAPRAYRAAVPRLDRRRRLDMSEHLADRPLQPGDLAPNVVLDAITRQGKIALEDFRGHKPVLIGFERRPPSPLSPRPSPPTAPLPPALHQENVDS